MSDPFSLHFEDTFFAEKYLDIDEFFLYHTQSVGYDSRESLENQYWDIVEKLRITIIEVIYNIIYYSKIEDRIKTKIANFLVRYNLLVNESDGYRTLAIDNEFPVLEGSFGVVLSCGVRARKALFYKAFAGSYFLSGGVKWCSFLRKWCSKIDMWMWKGMEIRDRKRAAI